MSYTSLFYHVVFSTKDRVPLLNGDVLDRTGQYVGGIVRRLRGQLVVAGGQPDHIHIAGVIPPTQAVSDFVGKVKSNSSGWIHDTFPGMSDFRWQDGYAAFTVSPSVLPKVKQYIYAQAEHHKQQSFEDELIALLDKHGIEYDEKYLRA